MNSKAAMNDSSRLCCVENQLSKNKQQDIIRCKPLPQHFQKSLYAHTDLFQIVSK